jgi:hypothetical protein
MLKKAKTPSNLDDIIEELEDAIKGADVETDRYDKMVSNLDTLYKLRNGHTPAKLEKKDWLPILGSIGSILIIVTFEAFGHTVTSKSVGFVSKLKS